MIKNIKHTQSIYMNSYNLIEAFVPLIGGGEFRWHFKHFI